MTISNSKTLFLFAAFLIFLIKPILGQEKTVNVERCKALDQSSPIHNIWVDEDNIKWVANSHGLNKVLSLDIVEKVNTDPGMTSLLMIRGGNALLEWNTAEMQQLIGNAVITCASYNAKTKTVWLGTQTSGAFEVSLSPLRLVQKLNTDNRKLTSNRINDIFIRNNGSIFIATDDGMLTGSGDKWTLQERYLNFIGVDAWNDNVWILGDNFLWQVDSKGKWSPIAIDLKNVEGQMRDIAVDDEGRVWIASNMMTGYDVAAEKYQRFGPGQYFTSQFVNCLDVDKDGSIWTGTNDKGLYLIQWESSLILSISQDKPASCDPQTPAASLSVKVAGGQAPYSYTWSNGQATAEATNLAPGEYKLTVTDVNGLVKTGSYIITDPGLKVNLTQLQSSTGSPAGDGVAKADVTGGSGQYIYQWDNGEYTDQATKLTTGTHSITVTDKGGCSAVANVTISESLEPLSVNIVVVKDNGCAGQPDGEIRADAKGGKGPYQFAWSGSKGNSSTIASLDEGPYTVTVTDQTGTTATASAKLTAPPALNASIQLILPANTSMSNGQAEAKATGGKPPYTYTWNNGETSILNKNLSPGQTVLTVTDANGCESVAVITMTENVVEMNASISQTGEIVCNGTGDVSLHVEVHGGKAPYIYNWNDGQKTASIQNLKAGNYQVTITDARGTIITTNRDVTEPSAVTVHVVPDAAASAGGNDGRATAKANGGKGNFTYLWDNGENENKAVKLSPGKHTVTATDASGCTGVGEVEISENILDLQVTLIQEGELKCAADATASVIPNVIGGKAPYTYTWQNNSSAASLTNAAVGLYTLTVTDALGHTATTVLTLDAPPPLEVSVEAEVPASANNNDGRASASVTGGKGKYTYEWSNGESKAKAEKLPAGIHTIIVTDENGCTAQGSVTISENILPLAVSVKEVNSIACAGKGGATIHATVNGGKEPYTYRWISGDQTWATASLDNVPGGSYTLHVTDVSGSQSTARIEIREPAPLTFTVEKLTPASTGNADGEVVIKVSGGKTPYTFRNTQLPGNINTVTIDQLSPGQTTMTITDAAGCSAEATFTVTEDILPLSAAIKETKTIFCEGQAGGTLEASVKGGKTPYIYSWSNGQSSSTLTNVAPGNYQLTVKDATGQETKAEHTIEAPAPMVVDVVNLRSATNDRIKDGKGGVEVIGGTGPFTYQWSSGETTAQAKELPLGMGKVIVTDQNGCTASAEFIIKEKALPELTAARLASGEPIRMEKIQFEADSTNINPEAIPSLDELYEFLYDNPTTIIEVAGHTNGLPADDYCDRISDARAKEVGNYLISKGIESRRIISKGYGKRKPIATNATPEGRKKNQRVEIRLIKIEE